MRLDHPERTAMFVTDDGQKFLGVLSDEAWHKLHLDLRKRERRASSQAPDSAVEPTRSGASPEPSS